MNINVNSTTYTVNLSKNSADLNGEIFPADIQRIDPGTFHVLAGSRSFMAEILETDRPAKKIKIKINGRIYHLTAKDQYSDLLSRLGMDSGSVKKLTELKAPMPGLVLHVFVKEGDEVKKGDNLITLEAMKMENILKSPADVTVKSVKVVVGDKVEKNQLLVTFQS